MAPAEIVSFHRSKHCDHTAHRQIDELLGLLRWPPSDNFLAGQSATGTNAGVYLGILNNTQPRRYTRS